MIMIDTEGPINPLNEGNHFIFVIVDAFSHYVTIMCAPKTIPTMHTPPYSNTVL